MAYFFEGHFSKLAKTVWYTKGTASCLSIRPRKYKEIRKSSKFWPTAIWLWRGCYSLGWVSGCFDGMDSISGGLGFAMICPIPFGFLFGVEVRRPQAVRQRMANTGGSKKLQKPAGIQQQDECQCKGASPRSFKKYNGACSACFLATKD